MATVTSTPTFAAASTATSVWDTNLFVLRADDRGELTQRIRAVVEFLDRTPDVNLSDLAFTLATEPAIGGSALAVVSGSAADLKTRLERVATRLADPKTTRIKDSLGTFWFDRPLYPEGRVAVLFPGEGAQYLNMLADLRGAFPEIRQVFDWCDSIPPTRPGDLPFSRLLMVPADASPIEREQAEAQLRQLGNSINSVLMADWALFLLLKRLGVPVEAVGGHSAGELAALWAAGGLDLDGTHLDRILSTMEDLERQEGDTLLLAVGAGKKTVLGLLGADAEAAYVAMDNCPHQSVVVGPGEVCRKLEGALIAKGLMVERLPFHRPYHTPLFEPFLPPLLDLFMPEAFHAPTLPVYSCSTGHRFPDDADAVRELALTHWARPVEFVRLIESMYADGVRLFVEAGPRGNLTAFVEDILRGKAFAAVPANVVRKSGPTQINHLAGLLTAHGVPLDLAYLFQGRSVQRLEWELIREYPRPDHDDGHAKRLPDARSSEVTFPSQRDEFRTPRGQVMTEYLRVMEQFLDVQRDVVGRFLAATPDLEPRTVELVEPARAWPLLGTVVRHEPGVEIEIHRAMLLAEDVIVSHHTLGGRNVSLADPEQCGLPILPMTFSLEIMAEAASVLVPGLKVIALRDIKLTKWVPYVDESATTLRSVATLLPDDGDGTRKVRVALTHLESDPNRPTSEGTVVLAVDYPAPPEPRPFVLTDPKPSRFDPPLLYKNLFHGEMFQGCLGCDSWGPEGIEARVRVMPRDRWFASCSEPALITDPVLMDIAMHPVVGWHLEQPHQAGRILLPIGVGSLEFFGPTPAPGTEFVDHAFTDFASSRSFIHSFELLQPDGTVWCRMQGAGYWRFYMPFDQVNFFGPKDEYYVSRDWPTALGTVPAGVEAAVKWFNAPPDMRQTVMLQAMSRVTLTPTEIDTFRAMKASEARKQEWVFGRLLGKDVARWLWTPKHNEKLFPADMEITPDEHGKPVVRLRGRTGPEPLPNISIAHADGFVAAAAAWHRPVGIDLEKIKPRPDGFEAAAFDVDELRLLDRLGGDRAEWMTRLWCAREAVAKALGRGLVAGPKTLAVRAADPENGVVVVGAGSKMPTAFPEPGSAGIIARTARDGEWVVATCFGESDPHDRR